MRCRATIAGAIMVACTAGSSAQIAMSQGSAPTAHPFVMSTDESPFADLMTGSDPSATLSRVSLRRPASIDAFTSTAADFSESFGKYSDTLLSYADVISGRTHFVNVDMGDTGNHVTAVTESERYALLFAGLAAIGFIARRRRED